LRFANDDFGATAIKYGLIAGALEAGGGWLGCSANRRARMIPMPSSTRWLAITPA
jgi:hypothetical protein